MDRRTFVKMAGITAGAVAFGTGLSRLVPNAAAGSHWGSGSETVPFQVPLPLPQVLTPVSTDSTTDYYQITMHEAQVQILPGLNTTIWGYNGFYPGPTIKAKSGRRVVVTQINNLPESTSVHLHGGHTPSASDGLPTDLIAPGGSKVYTYPNNQTAATLWYHDHAMDVTGPHVYRGLAGFYILQDDVELGLNLPSGNYDIPMVIQDRTFNADGSLYYPAVTGSVLKDGFLGDKVLVNGAIQPYFQVASRKYRFRILNGSNTRDYELALSSGGGSYGSGPSFIQIGTDGGLIPAPVARSTIPIAPGERVEVVIDFSPYAIGTQLVLKDNKGYNGIGDIMRFDVVRTETDTSSVPATLRPLPTLPAATVTRDIKLEFDRNKNQWVLNGKPFDPARIDAFPRIGSTEIWRFSNRSGMMHPMHIHDMEFQIVDMDGRSPGPGEVGWKDTVAVPSWGSVSMKVQFLDNTGIYVFHCHKLEHEDHAMMGQFQVVQ